MTGRCSSCGHVPAIHDRSGACPRWAGVRGLAAGTRVVFRIGRRWPECEGHVLAYFADSIDGDMVLVWDLTAGTQFEAPTMTAQREKGWTERPTLDQVREGQADLGLEIGDKVIVVRNLGQ